MLFFAAVFATESRRTATSSRAFRRHNCTAQRPSNHHVGTATIDQALRCPGVEWFNKGDCRMSNQNQQKPGQQKPGQQSQNPGQQGQKPGQQQGGGSNPGHEQDPSRQGQR
jgi:hypothetical protein